jgi:hypothetical protein
MSVESVLMSIDLFVEVMVRNISMSVDVLVKEIVENILKEDVLVIVLSVKGLYSWLVQRWELLLTMLVIYFVLDRNWITMVLVEFKRKNNKMLICQVKL